MNAIGLDLFVMKNKPGSEYFRSLSPRHLVPIQPFTQVEMETTTRNVRGEGVSEDTGVQTPPQLAASNPTPCHNYNIQKTGQWTHSVDLADKVETTQQTSSTLLENVPSQPSGPAHESASMICHTSLHLSKISRHITVFALWHLYEGKQTHNTIHGLLQLWDNIYFHSNTTITKTLKTYRALLDRLAETNADAAREEPPLQ